MNKTIFVLIIAIFSFSATFSQSNKSKVEVLYFKANLACCKAKACNVLEADVKAVIEKYFPNGNVTFKVVKIADEANKQLVEKYKAQSQTVVIVNKKNKKEKTVDVSDIVSNYAKTNNKEQFENELKEKITECLK